MTNLSGHNLIRVAVVGVVYFVIGYGSTLFDQPFSGLHFWRLAAWVASAVVYVAHVVYEHFKLRNSPITTAINVGLAVAFGGSCWPSQLRCTRLSLVNTRPLCDSSLRS